MKKYILSSVILLSLIFSTACNKYKAPYEITGASYTFDSNLNQCTLEDNSTGSSVTLDLVCDDFVTKDIYGLQYKRMWSNGEKDKEITLLRSIDLVTDGKHIYTYRCVRFASTQWINTIYRL